jgi:hypothetical protein
VPRLTVTRLLWAQDSRAGDRKKNETFFHYLMTFAGLSLFLRVLELQNRYSKKLNYSSKNSREFSTLELRCLTDFYLAPPKILL